MRTHTTVVFFGICLGIGVGIAVGSGPVAHADPAPSPIDVWPADYFALGGEADGAPTNVVSYLPDGWGTTEDQAFTSFIPGSGDYSAHMNLLNIPNEVVSTYQQVYD